MNEEENTAEQGAAGIQRRTIVKGAAWSIPVIAAAVAAPAASASVTPCEGRIEVTAASYIRDSTEGWYGELQSNGTGARLGIGGILPDSRMKANIALHNPTSCNWTGPVRLQIDLPIRLLRQDPGSEQGFTLGNGGNYTEDGVTWRRYYFTGTITVLAGQTRVVGINWALADVDTIRTYFGPQQGPQRWSLLPATQRSMGWRFRNPSGQVISAGNSLWSGAYNNTLAQNAGFWVHSNTVNAPTA